jgi:hypothetical protein
LPEGRHHRVQVGNLEKTSLRAQFAEGDEALRLQVAQGADADRQIPGRACATEVSRFHLVNFDLIHASLPAGAFCIKAKGTRQLRSRFHDSLLLVACPPTKSVSRYVSMIRQLKGPKARRYPSALAETASPLRTSHNDPSGDGSSDSRYGFSQIAEKLVSNGTEEEKEEASPPLENKQISDW